jgi:hypothetical protein
MDTLTMPGPVADAVTAVMADIRSLTKGETNKHANYKFASIDDFLDAVRPLCAKHKVVIVQDEDDFEIVKVNSNKGEIDWLRMRFLYTVAAGGMESKPLRRSIMVRADMGSQAFGAAQSYSLKQFERSLFQISTGDGEDADSHAQTTLAATQSASVVEDNRDWAAWGVEFDERIKVCETTDAVDRLRDTNKRDLNLARKASPTIYGAIGKAFGDRRAALTPMKEAA